jgi:CHAT domain
VVRSPAGEASAEVGLDAGRLLAGRARFEEGLLASGLTTFRDLTAEERAVREAGRALFTALLGTGEVAGLYRASAALADVRDEGLRIVLRLDAPELARLPWEAMYDPGAGGFVCRRHQLVRHVPVAAAHQPLAIRPPLRVLGVVSSPRDQEALDAGRERAQLTRALSGLTGQGLAELVWAPSATWDGLQQTLMAGPWHVLHFIGHGDVDVEQDEGVLALTREDGQADVIEAGRFADLLRQARPMPRLVMLNSCSGAAVGQGDLFSGTAAALARSGVAAVTAMQHAITDSAAVAFARGFYPALARGRSLDESVSAGRLAILGTSNRTLEWITPVLYLRGNDTRLFALPSPDAR